MSGKLTRRTFLRNTAAAAALAQAGTALSQASAMGAGQNMASGPFQPTWDSLKQNKTPDWFRDAKFGIWAHWSAQCVPEQGDWYARKMYLQGDPIHDWHAQHYGHPSKFGFMEIDNLWKAEKWQPEQLMGLYQAAGAKYFFALANHHDNFDNYASTYHPWNSTRIGPMRDIVGTWAKVARAHGMKFGVSNHSSHAWHWQQAAYGYDAIGPMANVRYDAATLTKADGKGKWWEGYDPQVLYTGRNNLAMPDGVNTIEAQNEWHKTHDAVWHEDDPPQNPRFAELWYLRCKELFDKYEPDIVYFDDTELPLGEKGLMATAHLYNSSIAKHGSQQSVVVANKIQPQHRGAFTLTIERSRSTEILEDPWQTATCIGEWHYKRSLYEQHKYKTAETVIPLLIDVISKNGNLLLSVPVRGDGSLDEDEHAFLAQLASWVPKHGEAIYGTRPYTIFGEGPPEPITNSFAEKTRPHTAEDIRFTTRGNTLYAFVLAWPTDGVVRVKTLRKGGEHAPRAIHRVELIGESGSLQYKQTADALEVKMPSSPPNPYAYVLRIRT
ncbi:alpha-L-fucosidase [Terriglobus roseus]|uniref:alpha-L-fucosidase n=1 Tax=Terriglobus roseus TaxID=392734 RepID=A0A1H4P1B2_9BACT|nr:alpha-L-fucosidase [Terriglobus roseus]SEC00948.1 alpha-L-fucosidase [Terriglobus roseus]